MQWPKRIFTNKPEKNFLNCLFQNTKMIVVGKEITTSDMTTLWFAVKTNDEQGQVLKS